MKSFINLAKRFFLFYLFFSFPILLVAQNSIVGTWNSTVDYNGDSYYINWTILSNGKQITHISGNGQTKKIIGFLKLNNGFVYDYDLNGNLTGYGSLYFVNNNLMKVTVIDNGNPQEKGQIRYYSRKQISFTGSLQCTKCTCSSWGGGSNYNGLCPNSGCHHSYVNHRRPGD